MKTWLKINRSLSQTLAVKRPHAHCLPQQSLLSRIVFHWPSLAYSTHYYVILIAFNQLLRRNFKLFFYDPLSMLYVYAHLLRKARRFLPYDLFIVDVSNFNDGWLLISRLILLIPREYCFEDFLGLHVDYAPVLFLLMRRLVIRTIHIDGDVVLNYHISIVLLRLCVQSI